MACGSLDVVLNATSPDISSAARSAMAPIISLSIFAHATRYVAKHEYNSSFNAIYDGDQCNRDGQIVSPTKKMNQRRVDRSKIREPVLEIFTVRQFFARIVQTAIIPFVIIV